MARVTINDCLNKVNNHFELVLLAAVRARQIISGKNPTILRKGSSNAVIALREIAEGTINIKNLKEQLPVIFSSAANINNLGTENTSLDENASFVSTTIIEETLVVENTNGDILIVE